MKRLGAGCQRVMGGDGEAGAGCQGVMGGDGEAGADDTWTWGKVGGVNGYISSVWANKKLISLSKKVRTFKNL